MQDDPALEHELNKKPEYPPLELCDYFDREAEEHPIIEHKAYYLKQEYPIEELLDYFGGEDD